MSYHIEEEGVKLSLNQNKEIDLNVKNPTVTKDMGTFYNPVMKIHRDISTLVMNTHFKNFTRKITFCDPMVASGIREARYLQKIPTIFSKMILGDISQESLNNCKKTFNENSVLDKVELEFIRGKAQNTMYQRSVDCIELDPYGSPAPFLDAAISQTNHGGLLCVTATDTASLCGVYPKKAKRRYNVNITKTFCFDDLGLRALIGNCQIRAGQFDKQLIVKVAFVHAHFYRIFFEVKDSAELSLQQINELKYVEWDRETQKIDVFDFMDNGRIGPLYVGDLRGEEFVQDCLHSIELLQESKDAQKLLEKIKNEVQVVGYYDMHKLQSYCGIKQGIKFDKLLEMIKEEGFEVSRSHCDKRGFKTTMDFEKLISFLKNLN